MKLSKNFDTTFKALTGNSPFPWQRSLFERFICDDNATRFPRSCDIPTGLGKTSVIAVWLLALAHHASCGKARSFPRRLVYVVNRRTVVDQSTREAEQLRVKLVDDTSLREVADALRGLGARSNGSESPLAISTLRGQFADNAEWRNDPARPAIVVGTVDMIGSRLLFSGYGCGFKSRPLHAGFLAQDVVLVHDEAHLEPAFQELVEAIHAEQRRNKWEIDRFHVMALSATNRSGGETHTITDEDLDDDTVKERVDANKAIRFHDVVEDKKIGERVTELALEERFKASGQAILVFVRQVKDVLDIKIKLEKAGQQVETLTGTLRGYERDKLVESPIFARFLPHPNVVPAEGTVYLVCTSAGEVGVNISADHLICDLAPFDSMAQRFGRVHRFGRPRAHVAFIEIVASTAAPKSDDELSRRIVLTRALLEQLPQRADSHGRSASPAALRELPTADRLAAFSPQPVILPATDILFDAWAMTTIREPLPGRPPVDDYLHGVNEYEPPQTQIAWRDEVEKVVGTLLEANDPNDLIEDFPLKAHELLSDRTDRVLAELLKVIERCPDAGVWVLERSGKVRSSTLAKEVSAFDKKRVEATLAGCTVLLPPSVGALSKGMLDGAASSVEATQYDVSDEWKDDRGRPRRMRTFQDTDPSGMRLIRSVNISKAPEQADADDEPGEVIWRWYVQPRYADDDGSKNARAREFLNVHLGKAGQQAEAIAQKLVGQSEATAIVRGAQWHDLGKNRRVWQRSIGNFKADILAKSGPGMKAREITRYRHEFGSLIDVEEETAFSALSPELQDLVLHLIAAHHGRARPHFPIDEAFDPERPAAIAGSIAREVPRRFARLQTHYGRWGLAYLESLVRAADALASQDIRAMDEAQEAAE